MVEDNIYVNDGAFFAPDPEILEIQNNESEKEEREVRTSAPTLVKAIDHLKKQADFYESVNAISSEYLSKPEEFMHIVAGNKLAAITLRAEANSLEILLKEYVTERQ